MSNKKIAFLLINLLIIASIFTIIIPFILINQNYRQEFFTPPFFIDGNLNFDQMAIENNWKGDGTESNPYVIENLTIKDDNSKYGISINNVSKFFIINNCFIRKSKFGILINNSKNGIIKKCTFLDETWSGIEIINSNSIIIINNSFSSIFWASIEILNSNNSKLEENDINKGFNGINLINISFCLIQENFLYDNDYGGISIKNSFNNTIDNNYFVHGKKYGVYSYNSINNLIQSNQILRNEYYGIFISTSNHTFLNKNFIEDNRYFGIYLQHSLDLSINQNFINSREGTCIYIRNSNKTIVNDNILSNSIKGIDIREGFFNEINENCLSNINYTEILLKDSKKNKFFKNNLNAECDYGFYLLFSNENEIIKNSIYSNANGIYLKNSCFNNISLNLFNNCGIIINEEDSSNNGIAHN